MTLKYADAAASVALACCAVVAVSASPAQAAAGPDPERTVTLQSRGTAQEFAATPQRIEPLRRGFVSSASANTRIAAKLPGRSSSAAIGRNYAVSVVDAMSGQRIWSHRSTRALLPASNMKIITAANALTVLGSDHRFTTKVVALGRGRVAILGGGDATLSSRAVRRLARRTVAAVQADASLRPAKYTPKPYRPKTCRVHGKRVKNTARHRCPLVTPGSRRAAVKVFVDDSLYPAASRPPGWTGSYQPSIVRPVRALGMDGRYVWDSAADTGSYFASRLRADGMRASYSGRQRAPDSARVLTRNESVPLAEQVKYMLQVSENNIAEMLFRNTAVALGYRPTWGNSRTAAGIALRRLGVPTTSLHLADGSGVGRLDRVTPVALTTLLQRVADKSGHPNLAPIYYGGGLPLAGKSGTLGPGTGRFVTRPTSCARGKLRAKTGTLFDTIGLSGLTVGRDGHLKAFSVLVNSRPQRVSPLTTRKSVDRIAATVTGCY
ncbi:MAG: D-alanyl-D-alanine carboxypeptidase/D-alanyl-D-alanine-endopeptidase [Candidatus Nanopelagicales bacterium]